MRSPKLSYAAVLISGISLTSAQAPKQIVNDEFHDPFKNRVEHLTRFERRARERLMKPKFK